MTDLRYLTDHYDAKIQRVRDIGAPLNFLFMTDMHNRLNHGGTLRTGERLHRPYELAKDHIASLQYVLDRCPSISFVVCGGDIGNDYDHDPAAIRRSHQEVMDAFYALSVPVHCCVGNHDDALGNATDRGVRNAPYVLLPDEMHRLCMKYNPTPENYYFIDLPDQPYRLIFLNSCDRPYEPDAEGEYPFGWRLEISNRQAQWLEDEALRTGRKIIVFSHAPLRNEGIFGTEGQAANYIKPYDDTLNAPRVYHALQHCPRVIAMIHGHVHYDNLLYRDGMVTVTTLCSLVQEWAPSCPRRVFGTITETAFDVFSIKDGVLYVTRFGAGEDRIATLLR
jgi:UDP-2,3-diacylglucosamine pyrophosphatase LpxH